MSPKFKYKAKEVPHELLEGVVEAADYGQAVDALIKKGLTPIEVRADDIEAALTGPAKGLIEPKALKARINRNEVVYFTRQMSDMLDAAVPIYKALQLVSRKTRDKEFRSIIDQMGEGIRNGASFSSELSRHQNIFSPYYVQMVRAGEMAGRSEIILGRLAGYLEKEQEIAGKVKASLAYPLLILFIGFLVVFILLSFVIPRFVIMFEDAGQSLPLPTTILMMISGLLARFWWLIGVAFIIGSDWLIKWGRTDRGKRWIDWHLLKMWVVGPFIQAVETGRFARVLGTLIENGVAIVKALDIAKETVSNHVLREQLSAVSSEVLHGMSLGNALKKVEFFPEMVSDMIYIGEETGHFEKGLYKIADIYEREAERMMATSVSLLGPMVLIGLVAVVGFIVIAIMLPIMQMNQLIR